MKGQAIRTVEILGPRALNRALLARQLLLRRSPLTVTKAIHHLVGLQSQLPESPYFALWSRLAHFHPEALARLIGRRRVVRVALMRSTIHLVTARDCLELRPVLESVQQRSLYVGSPFGRRILGMDVQALIAHGRELLERQPRTLAALAKLLGERWPERDATSMAQAIRNLVPLVQLPPRGIWGKGGLPLSTTAEAWLGRPLATDRHPEKLIRRYLAAFGPATARDVQAWSGLMNLQEVMDAMRLRTFRDESDDVLYDLPRSPRPDAKTPAPVRFLPDFDNALLGHADRRRIFIQDEDRARRLGKPTFLVDGFVRGNWKIQRQKGKVMLTLASAEWLAPREVAALISEAKRLLAFAVPEAAHRVRFARVG